MSAQPRKPRPGLWNEIEAILRAQMEPAWTQIGDLLADYVEDRTTESYFARLDAEKFLAFMLAGQKILFDADLAVLRQEFRREKGFGPRPIGIRRACRTLGITPPRTRTLVDLDKARRAMRALAVQYHPDKNNGSRQYENQYQEVVEAWATVRTYNNNLSAVASSATSGA